MSDTIKIHGENQVIVAGKVEDIYTDIYGLDGWKRVKISTGIKIRARNYPDQVIIKNSPDGAVVDVSKAQGTVESRIAQMESHEQPNSQNESAQSTEPTSRNENDTLVEQTSIDEGPNDRSQSDDSKQVTFTPPRTKDQARYHGPAEGENPELDCMDCAHYIEGGNCHIVQGDINPEGHCENYYADVGVFAKITDDSDWNINLRLWGERWRPKAKAMFKSAESSARKLSERVDAMIRSNWRK